MIFTAWRMLWPLVADNFVVPYPFLLDTFPAFSLSRAGGPYPRWPSPMVSQVAPPACLRFYLQHSFRPCLELVNFRFAIILLSLKPRGPLSYAKLGSAWRPLFPLITIFFGFSLFPFHIISPSSQCIARRCFDRTALIPLLTLPPVRYLFCFFPLRLLNSLRAVRFPL